MAKITKVPNGPLIKKKGPFKGSTLKTGGVIKKAQNGDSTVVNKPKVPYVPGRATPEQRAAQQLVREDNIRKRDSVLQRNANVAGITREELRKQQEKNDRKPEVSPSGDNAISLKEARQSDCKITSKKGCGIAKEANRQNKRQRFKNGGIMKKAQQGYTSTTKVNTSNGPRYYQGKSPDMATAMKIASFKSQNTPADSIPKAKVPKNKLKAGGMIKRADGSMSKRGLWDNIRANKGSGKKPTKQMLVQEKKIKAKAKK